MGRARSRRGTGSGVRRFHRILWMQSKAEAVHDWGIASPGAKLGEAAGYAMGWVAIQVILVACTRRRIRRFGSRGQCIGKARRRRVARSPTAGKAVIGAARLVTLLAEVTGALGEALNALQDAALQPLRKALARILDPLRDLLASLEALIDKVRLAAARGESGRIEMSSEELARRIRGRRRGPVPLRDPRQSGAAQVWTMTPRKSSSPRPRRS